MASNDRFRNSHQARMKLLQKLLFYICKTKEVRVNFIKYDTYNLLYLLLCCFLA